MLGAGVDGGTPKEYRIQSAAVLLTYQGVAGLGPWERFLAFAQSHLKSWKVKCWTATLETNADGTHHIHLMVQFTAVRDSTLQAFRFEGIKPNAASRDTLGGALNKKYWQSCVDRGHFYVWANKKGTVVDARGHLCVAGNYTPAWTEGKCTYLVLGGWPHKLWAAYKLTDEVYEEYLHLCKDGISGRKRTLDAYREWATGREQHKTMVERTRSIQSNPALHQQFGPVEQAMTWLALFRVDALRYPILLVRGPSLKGKTEWALSLFANALEVKIGALSHFPASMRKLDRRVHDGLVLDDIRDVAFLSQQQEKYKANITP